MRRSLLAGLGHANTIPSVRAAAVRHIRVDDANRDRGYRLPVSWRGGYRGEVVTLAAEKRSTVGPVPADRWDAAGGTTMGGSAVSGAGRQGTFTRALDDLDFIRFVAGEMLGWFGPDRAMFGTNFPAEKLWTALPPLVAAWRAAVAGLVDDRLSTRSSPAPLGCPPCSLPGPM